MKEEYLLTGELEKTNEPYAIAKIAGIKMCENYYRQYNSNFFSVMPTNLYGPNDNFDLETSHVLPALLRKMHLAHLLEKGDIDAIRNDLKTCPFSATTEYNGTWSNDELIKYLATFGIHTQQSDTKDLNAIRDNSGNSWTTSLEIWGTGTPKREFLHVDDMAEACVYLMQEVEAEDVYSQGITHLNIGVGADISINDLAALIADIVGYQGEIEHDTSKPDGTPRKLLHVSWLNSLGWEYSISLRKGIRSAYQWYLEN